MLLVQKKMSRESRGARPYTSYPKYCTSLRILVCWPIQGGKKRKVFHFMKVKLPSQLAIPIVLLVVFSV